jgi:uncharacterized membrane protein (DUF485 family)
VPDFINIHVLDNAWQVALPFMIGTSLIAWLVGVISVSRAKSIKDSDKKNTEIKRFFAAIAVFCGIIILLVYESIVVKPAAQTEVRPYLAAEITAVNVEGKPFYNSTLLIEDIRKMSEPMAHHSHPIHKFEILLKTSKGNLILFLGRDSQNPQEYWVFYPGFKGTKLNKIGTVFTAALDNLR